MSSATGSSDYEPTLSQEEIERLTSWHERAYQEMRTSSLRHVKVHGLELEIPPQVFPPPPMSELLGAAILREVTPADRILDMGTGSGINALLAASTAREVVGVDVNPHAVEAARLNARRNGLAARTRFFESDVFEAVDGRFDLIIFDPPFRWLKPRDLLERSIADENYASLTRFMTNVRRHLSPGGRILIFFGTSGDLGYLQRLVEENGFRSEVVASRDLERDGITVSYFTFRLTR